jgi:hypothetical protein
LVIYSQNSKNSKLSNNDLKVDCTYTSIEKTCPSSCPMKKDKSCYASIGFVGIHEKRSTKASENLSAFDLAKEEADLIIKNSDTKSKFLRLHVSGDSITKKGTKFLAKASDFWMSKTNGKVWTYTHAWKEIPKSYWGKISVLASVDSVKEANEAYKKNYVPAIIVSKFESKKSFKLKNSDIKFIPCPAQTHENISCASCKLCFDSNKLYNLKTGIAFEAHGPTKEKIKRRLNLLNGNAKK